MVVGIYRSNVVDDTHALSRVIRDEVIHKATSAPSRFHDTQLAIGELVVLIEF
jgi:hypothetical protein